MCFFAVRRELKVEDLEEAPYDGVKDARFLQDDFCKALGYEHWNRWYAYIEDCKTPEGKKSIAAKIAVLAQGKE